MNFVGCEADKNLMQASEKTLSTSINNNFLRDILSSAGKSILPTTDYYLVKGTLQREGAYDSLAYDGSPHLDLYRPSGVWILLLAGAEIAGFINFIQMNNVMWSPHIFIFEEHRGDGSEEWGKMAAEFMKDKCGAKKFLALTPYISAVHYAERVGFSQVAVLPASIQKNGTLLDQYVLHLNTGVFQ